MPTETFNETQSDDNNLELEVLVKRIKLLDCEPWVKENVVQFARYISISMDDNDNFQQKSSELPPYDRILLSWLIKAKWDPNNPKTGGVNLVKQAVITDDVYYFNMLLECGFDPKTSGILQLACVHNSVIIFDRLQRLNLKIDEKNENGCTPLFSACLVGNFSMVQTLLDQGAFINGWHAAGTPLHAACISGNIYIVGLLIKRGALIEIRNEFGETPLHLACKMGKFDIVKLLVYFKAAINVSNIAAHTPLHLAVYNGEFEIAEFLIEKKANINSAVSSPLFISCLQGHPVEFLVKLIAAGADVNDKNVKDMTPLHAAVYKNYPEAVELLLANGADCDAKDDSGRTPIHYAAKLKLTEILKMMLKATRNSESRSRLSDVCSASSNTSFRKSKSFEYNCDAKENIDILENFINNT